MNVDELQEQINECQEHLPTGHSSLNLSNLLRKASRCESFHAAHGEHGAGERDLSPSGDAGSQTGDRRSSRERERMSSPGVTSLDRRESSDRNAASGSAPTPPRCSSAQPPPSASSERGSSRDRNEHRESGSFRCDGAKAAHGASTPTADGNANASLGTNQLPPAERPAMSERRSASPFAMKSFRTIDSDTSAVGGSSATTGQNVNANVAPTLIEGPPAVSWNPLFEGSPSNAAEMTPDNQTDAPGVPNDNEVHTAESVL